MAWQPDYLTSSELKDALGVTDTADDVEVAMAISAASRAIDHSAGRQFGVLTSAAARYYRPAWDSVRRRWAVVIDDLMTTTDLVVKTDEDDDGTFEITVTDYQLAPYNAAADVRPWTYLIAGSGVSLPCRDRGVEITAKWGWTSVPAVVEQACLTQAARFFKRKGAPFGIAGSPDMGTELRLLQKLDPDVAVLLSAVRRYWSAR